MEKGRVGDHGAAYFASGCATRNRVANASQVTELEQTPAVLPNNSAFGLRRSVTGCQQETTRPWLDAEGGAAMYSKIMVPVDLAHADKLGKALATAADLAKHYGVPVCYVGVTTATPSEVAHNPAEFAEKLEAFGQAEAAKHGLLATTASYAGHDPTIDLDATLLKAVGDTGADLVVMQSHLPGFVEHIFASNAGYLASHSSVSVFVVR